MIEVEVKSPLKDLTEVRKILIRQNAEALGSVEELDVYFTHPFRNFAETDEVLRIRYTTNGKHYVTYKGPKVKAKARSRMEVHVSVEDGNAFREIFEKLGFKEVASVKKFREKWRLEDLQVYLDKVEELGFFIEVEALVENNKDISLAESRIFNLLKTLGVDPKNTIKESYLELILRKKNII